MGPKYKHKDGLDLFQKKQLSTMILRHYMIHNMLLIICLTKALGGSTRELGHFYKLFKIHAHNIT